MKWIDILESFFKGTFYGFLLGILLSVIFLYWDYVGTIKFIEVLNNG